MGISVRLGETQKDSSGGPFGRAPSPDGSGRADQIGDDGVSIAFEEDVEARFWLTTGLARLPMQIGERDREEVPENSAVDMECRDFLEVLPKSLVLEAVLGFKLLHLWGEDDVLGLCQ